MIRPETLQRSFEALGQLDDPRDALMRRKLIETLHQGFRITTTRGNHLQEHSLGIVTRREGDLFVASVDYGRMDRPNFGLDLFEKMRADVRRKKGLVSPDSRTLERWSISGDTLRPYSSEYRVQTNKGGILTFSEFVAGYCASTVELDATRQHANIMLEGIRETEPRDVGVTIVWIADEVGKLQTT